MNLKKNAQVWSNSLYIIMNSRLPKEILNDELSFETHVEH